MTINLANGDDLELLLARTIALELMMRGILAGLVGCYATPAAELDRLGKEFHETLSLIRTNEKDEALGDRMYAMTKAIVDQNLDAIRARIVRVAELQAARAGAKN